MPEMHLRQCRFRYSACGPFTKKKERIIKFKETDDSRYIYQNELDKACFEHDVACGDFKDLNRRTAVDKVSRGKTFNIAKNSKYDGYQRGYASVVYKFFDKKSCGNGIKNENNFQTNNWLKNYTDQLLENLIKEKYTHLL